MRRYTHCLAFSFFSWLQVVGDLIIPDEMRDFINNTYASQAPAGLSTYASQTASNADSTVVDSPAATAVDSTSGLDVKPTDTKPTTTLTSCMYETQAAGRSSTQQLGTAAVRDIRNTVSGLPAPAQPFNVPATASYFRSPQAYPNNHEVQVSQVSQSWRAGAAESRNYGTSSGYHQQRTLDLSADDAAVRHRRNPHQMNWWARTYGYHHANSPAGNYRPNYSLPAPSIHPPRTAASFVSSQTSPSCNQVCTVRLFL